MKKIFGVLMFFIVICFAGISYAQYMSIGDLRINPSLVTNSSGTTDTFNTIKFDDQTTNVINVDELADVGVGTTYIDTGHAFATQLRDINGHIISNDLGLGAEWGLWIDWEITGQVAAIVNNIYYIDYIGGTANMYLATTDYSFGNTQSVTDDTLPSEMYSILSANVNTNDSHGYVIYDSNNDELFRNTSVKFNVTYLNDSILFSDSYDLTDMLINNLLSGLTTESASSGLSYAWHDGYGHTIIDASGTGSVQMAAPVPEPASVMLFGMGLVGLAGMMRKRTIK